MGYAEVVAVAKGGSAWRRHATLRRTFVPVGMTVPEWVDEVAGTLSPEKQLWFAVLLDAIALCGPGTWHRRDRAEAQRWLADDGEWIGSYVYVCDALNLSPSAVRRATKDAARSAESAPQWWDHWWGKVQQYLRAA